MKKRIYIIWMVLLTFKVIGQTDFLTKAKSYYNLDSNIVYGEKHLRQSLASTYNSKDIIKAYRYVVSNYFNKGKFAHAKNTIQEMLSLSYRNHDKEMEYVGIGLLGDFEKYSTNYSKAVNFYLIAYNGLEKGHYWENLCRSTIDLIELNRAIAKYNEAELYIKQASKLFKEHQLNDPTILVRLYNRTAAVKNETGRLELIDSSIVYSKLALKINQQLKNKNDEAITWNELGYSYRHLKKIDTAEYCFNMAEKIWFESGIDISAINAISNKAALYAAYKVKQQEVIPLYLKIIETVKSKNINYDLDNVYKGLGDFYYFKKDINNALKYYKLYHDAYIIKLSKIQSTQIDDIKEKHEKNKAKEKVISISKELNQSKNIVQEQKRQKLVVFGVAIIFLLLLVVLGYLSYKLKQANRILNYKNLEKDSLIQEIHHRVKNNLQFVSSLMNMQISSSHNPNDIDVLTDATRRIRAMALVHEMLYNQNELQGLDIKQYLSELIQSITDIVNTKHLQIKFTIEVESLYFNTNKSIALGMITSELISNSIKYAFNLIEKPEIHIKLSHHKTSNQIEYTVMDNGIGLKSITNDDKKLGLRLIDIFSRQLKGTFDFKNNNGLTYSIIFDAN